MQISLYCLNAAKRKKSFLCVELEPGFFLSFTEKPQEEWTTPVSCTVACWVSPLGETSGRKKHISHHQYSHFLAEESDTLVFRAASLLRQAELFLVFGVLLLQRLELSARHRREERRSLEYEYIKVKQLVGGGSFSSTSEHVHRLISLGGAEVDISCHVQGF